MRRGGGGLWQIHKASWSACLSHMRATSIPTPCQIYSVVRSQFLSATWPARRWRRLDWFWSWTCCNFFDFHQEYFKNAPVFCATRSIQHQKQNFWLVCFFNAGFGWSKDVDPSIQLFLETRGHLSLLSPDRIVIPGDRIRRSKDNFHFTPDSHGAEIQMEVDPHPLSALNGNSVLKSTEIILCWWLAVYGHGRFCLALMPCLIHVLFCS